MDETQVPPHPVVEIEVSAEAVTVDGVVVDQGSAGLPDDTVPMHLGVHAAARQVAQPLGRPVRAILRRGADEKRLVIHPDGSVTDVEDTFAVVSLVAPPGSRASRTTGHARRRRGADLRARRKKLAMGAAYVALGTVLVGGVLVEVGVGDDPARPAEAQEKQPTPEPIGDPEPPAAAVPAVAEGSRLDRLPGIRQVAVSPDAGGFRLRVTTGRAVRVKVLASLLSGEGEARLWTIGTARATTRTLEIDDLPAGTYRWVVRSPGERPRSGRVVVRPTPAPPSVVTVGTTPEQAPPPAPDAVRPPRDDGGDGGGDGDGGAGGSGGGGVDSTMPGPTKPVDPDEPNAR